MLTDNDILFNDNDESQLLETLNVGDEYHVPGTIVCIYNDDGKIEAAKQFSTHSWFIEILQNSSKIECVNDDCSIIKFVDINNNEINQLTTTSQLGSMLASNPKLHFGHSIRTKKE